MSYDSDERSISQNRPIDLLLIQSPSLGTFGHTSHTSSITVGPFSFTPSTLDRSAIQVNQDAAGRELIVSLPITHPVVLRFCATGIPEQAVTITLFRMQEVSGQTQQQWTGFATGLRVVGHMAEIRVPSQMDDALKVRLPVIRAQKICNHVLFDNYCSPSPGTNGPDPAAFRVSTTVVSQSIAPGVVTLAVASVGGNPDDWATFGDVNHVASGQRSFIVDHTGTSLKLDKPLVNVSVGDALTITAGCAHDNVTCRDKFSNILNFGGFPEINSLINPWALNGLGTIQQP